MKYAWIKRHQSSYPVSLMCEVLNVNVSGYCEHHRQMQAARHHRGPSQEGQSVLQRKVSERPAPFRRAQLDEPQG